jgi:general secretion pathway protein B
MSSILKALQKLENDKSSRQTREPDISSAIIREKQRRSTRTQWILPILITAVAATSIILTYTFMGGFSANRKAEKLFMQQHSPLQYPIATTIHPAQFPNTPSTSAQIALPTVDRSANPTLSTHRSKKPRSLTNLQPTPALTVSESSPPTLDAPQTPSSHPSTDYSKEKLLTFPTFSINGIAWQKDSASRLAVVNGVPVGEGGMLEGAKIEQIFQDRVRFSLGGKSFEVSMEREGRK